MGKPFTHSNETGSRTDPALLGRQLVAATARLDGNYALTFREGSRVRNVPIDDLTDLVGAHQEIITEAAAREMQAELNRRFPDTVLVRPH